MHGSIWTQNDQSRRQRVLLSNRPHFIWTYRGDNPLGSWVTSFSSVLPTSRVGYHAGKPIESVVYCFYKINLSFPWVYRHNKPQVFNQSERAYYLSYSIKVKICFKSTINTSVQGMYYKLYASVTCVASVWRIRRGERKDMGADKVISPLLSSSQGSGLLNPIYNSLPSPPLSSCP